jgi:2-oxoglutarate dehydrogenase E1 component
MTTNDMQAQQKLSYLVGDNTYLEDLYEDYLKNPQNVSGEWREYFSTLSKNADDISHADIREYFQKLSQQRVRIGQVVSGDVDHERKQAQVVELIEAYRKNGHYRANLDPLGMMPYRPVRSLDLIQNGLTENDFNTLFNTVELIPEEDATLQIIYNTLKKTYCGTIGFEYKYIADDKQIKWLQQRIESVQGHPELSPETKLQILKSLTQAEGLEKYLGAKYVGQTRFSLEGGESLMPMMDQLINCATEQKIKEIVIGMGHRGRLNVLVNTLGKAPRDLFQAFEGKHMEPGSGDVKYHLGFASDIGTAHGSVHIALAFNPSHLEIIDPVVEGAVRARQDHRDDKDFSQILPVLIHGDAAFSGQGVVMETFNLSQTRGFGTGGTIHIVVNNQIGFTISDPKDSRSTWYCTDIAKMIEAPVFHVNADDPEAAIFVMQLAMDFRYTFKKDVVIDLVCYRRHGHNEGDEPSATQPLMYQKIKQLPSVYHQYAEKLIAEKIIDQTTVDNLMSAYRDILDSGKEVITARNGNQHEQYATDWKPYQNTDWKTPAKTGVSVSELKSLAKKLETLPKDFVLQPQVAKLIEDRRKMTADELPMNWGYAETLAYATLLHEGYSIRMSGQDCKRGTFAHRHAVLHDYQTDKIITPLESVTEKNAKFIIVDSLLSEEAVLGFEYGYATASPETLVIWEAQYGDFANGAQVIIDQFISSAEQKWGLLCGLTLFLPHGYQGAGPEHSSGRIERFLQNSAEHNMQVCQPTTPSQIFHLLRRQMLRPYRKPLIVFTPKNLLRHKLVVSTFEDLSKGQFELIIPEIDADIKTSKARRVIFCSGKIYYELLEQRRENKQTDIAIVRIEQLYPYPLKEIRQLLQQYKNAKEIVWCQEEPKNQGAWYSTVNFLTACLAPGQTVQYVGRKAFAAPAGGSKKLHDEQQKALIDEALK